MTPGEQPIKIIGNESNHIIEVKGGDAARAAQPEKTDATATGPTHAAERKNDEVATNDGAVIETLDTAFHNKPGVAEGENPSGSDRADYYEARSYGKTDSEEELDTLNNEQP